MGFCAWNVRNPYKSGSLTTVARELARCKLDSLDVQEVRWDKGGTLRAGHYICFCGKGNKIHQFGKGLWYTTEQYKKLRGYSLLKIG